MPFGEDVMSSHGFPLITAGTVLLWPHCSFLPAQNPSKKEPPTARLAGCIHVFLLSKNRLLYLYFTTLLLHQNVDR